MKSITIIFVFCLFISVRLFAEEVPSERLDQFAREMRQIRAAAIGYPVNQNTDLKEFYEWYLDSRLYEVSMNNVGDPQQTAIITLNTHEYENEVIRFFAPLYGFSEKEAWGFSSPRKRR